MKRLCDEGNPQALAQANEARDQAAREIYRLFKNIVKDPKLAESQSKSIVAKAVDIAIKYGEQRCRLQVIVPSIGDVYERGKTQGYDLDDECDDSIKVGEVCCVTVPAVKKTGDGHGGRLDLSQIVFNAKVGISPLS